MSDTPDLSKIVNLIMQNPHLISEIQSLAKGEKKDEGEESSEAQTRTEASVKADVPPRVSKSEKRGKLLASMKPYLREERARSIDTFLTIADMLDTLRSK